MCNPTGQTSRVRFFTLFLACVALGARGATASAGAGQGSREDAEAPRHALEDATGRLSAAQRAVADEQKKYDDALRRTRNQTGARDAARRKADEAAARVAEAEAALRDP